MFGLRETADAIKSKVSLEDQILSLEVKKSMDRRSEFWLEFENGVKMFACMLDQAPAS